MSKNTLVRYIRLVLETTRDARVPNQLLNVSDSENDKDDKKEIEDVNEFSGCGAVAGYTAPLGADASTTNRKKNSIKRI